MTDSIAYAAILHSLSGRVHVVLVLNATLPSAANASAHEDMLMQRRYTRTFVLLAGIAITTASGVGAQSSAIVQAAAAPVAAGRVPTNAAVVGAPLAGPRMQPVALLRTSVVDSVAPLPLPRDPGENVGQNLAMMGVGAAGLAAGLLIGGDGGNAIAIVGAVVGLLGLYRYMR